jgi:hypothetical protein
VEGRASHSALDAHLRKLRHNSPYRRSIPKPREIYTTSLFGRQSICVATTLVCRIYRVSESLRRKSRSFLEKLKVRDTKYMNTSSFHKVKDLWQPASSQAAITTERPRASSTGRLRTVRKGGSIVQEIYDRLGIKREDLQTPAAHYHKLEPTASTMIQRTSSLDEAGYVLKKVFDVQDSNVASSSEAQTQVPDEQTLAARRRLSYSNNNWPSHR